MINRVESGGQVSVAAIQNMDVETAMMAVQCNRVNIIDGQLKAQISETQANNNRISKLNELLGALNKTAAAFSGDAKADAAVAGVKGATLLCAEVGRAALAAGIADLKTEGGDTNGFGVKVTKGALDGKIQEVKSMIDSQSNTQQMNMLRLQSLSNKRNEAYDTVSSFMKKCADGRSSILSTWR